MNATECQSTAVEQPPQSGYLSLREPEVRVRTVHGTSEGTCPNLAFIPAPAGIRLRLTDREPSGVARSELLKGVT
jgi:hypothetical protein